MRYHPLGASDLVVSEISYGCMSLGQDDQANARLIHRACELGINLFDTADMYGKGQNELTLGKALKDRRDQVLIASKVGNQWRPDGSGWDWNPRKAYILEAVENSLRRLQTDYLDLYQLHGGTIDDPIDETIEAFEWLQAQGKIRWYGISSIRPNVIGEYLRRARIVSVMMQYSLLDRRPEEAILDLLAAHNTSIIVRGALAKGLLAGKPPREYQEHSETDVAAIAFGLAAHAGTGSLAQAALRYSLSHPAVATVAAGASSLSQLEENAAAGDLPPLSQEEKKALQALGSAGMYEQHR